MPIIIGTNAFKVPAGTLGGEVASLDAGVTGVTTRLEFSATNDGAALNVDDMAFD